MGNECGKRQDAVLFENIINGSNFMIWGTLKLMDDDAFFDNIPNSDIIKKQMRNLHIYEVKGITDRHNDTLRITSDVFINNTRLLETETSISGILDDPESFIDLLSNAQSSAIRYLAKHLVSYMASNASSGLMQTLMGDDRTIDMSKFLDEHLYTWNEYIDADENGIVIEDEEPDISNIPETEHKVDITKYELKSANPKDKADVKTVENMMSHIGGIVFSSIKGGKLFLVEIKYQTINVVGESIEATTILDSDVLFNDIRMLGAFSFRDDNIIMVKPEMREFISQKYENPIVVEFLNTTVTEHVYTVLDFLGKVKDMNSNIIISVKGGLKDEEDFWDYV